MIDEKTIPLPIAGLLPHTAEKYRPKRVSRKQRLPASEWQEIIGKFRSRINVDRIRDGYHPLPAAAIITRMVDAGISSERAHYFFLQCEQAPLFSKYFFGVTKGLIEKRKAPSN